MPIIFSLPSCLHPQRKWQPGPIISYYPKHISLRTTKTATFIKKVGPNEGRSYPAITSKRMAPSQCDARL